MTACFLRYDTSYWGVVVDLLSKYIDKAPEDRKKEITKMSVLAVNFCWAGGRACLIVLYGANENGSARPDIAELDVFLGQHNLLTLEQHFNPKI